MRVEHTRNYLVVLNSTVLDQRLRLAVRGFLLCLLTLPDHWRFNLRDLARRFHTTKETVSRYLLALQRTGYCEASKSRSSEGRFKVEYIIHETPVLKNETGDQSRNTRRAKSDVFKYPVTKYRGGEASSGEKLGDSTNKTVSPSLRSALEAMARAAGIGTMFMTQQWWSGIRELSCRDDVGAASILGAFEVCLAVDLQDVRFFADRFPKYVAFQKRRDASNVVEVRGRQIGRSEHRSEAAGNMRGHEGDASQEERRVTLAEHAARGSKFAADLLKQSDKEGRAQKSEIGRGQTCSN